MKILMVHPHDLYSPIEPWTIRIVKLAEQLSRKGHEVRIAYFPMATRKKSFFGVVEAIPLARIVSLGMMIKNTRILCALAGQADLIHLQKSHFYAALPAVLAAFWCGKPLHYDWDDWEEKIYHASLHRETLTTFLTGLSFRLMERWLPFLADSVSVASEKLRALALRRGASAEKIALVPVGADLELFSSGGNAAHDIREKHNVNGELLVLYHGQLHSCQYVKLFLWAARIIFDGPHASKMKFMVLGDGSELERLKQFSENLGVGESVVFAGYVPHSEVPAYIAAADICVAPFEDNEITECKSPLKIVEYLAAGKAIVASDVGEVRNMLEDAGLLVEPGDSDKIAGGILELALNDARRKTLAGMARQRVETKYNWRSSAHELEKVYRKIAG